MKAGNETLAAAILSTYADAFVAAYKVDQARVLWSSKENAFATGKMVVAAYPDNPQAASAYIGILNGPASEAQLARRSEIRRVAPRAVRAAHAKQLWKLATELGAEYAEAVAYAGNMPGSEPSWSPGECEEVRAQRPLEVFDLSIQAARRFCELARDKEQMELEVEARSDLSMIVARKILYLGWSVGGRNYAEALKVFHDHEAYAKTFHTQEGWYEYPASEHPSPASDPIMRWAGAAIAEALLASPEYREQGLALVEVYPQDRISRSVWRAWRGRLRKGQAPRIKRNGLKLSPFSESMPSSRRRQRRSPFLKEGTSRPTRRMATSSSRRKMRLHASCMTEPS